MPNSNGNGAAVSNVAESLGFDEQIIKLVFDRLGMARSKVQFTGEFDVGVGPNGVEILQDTVQMTVTVGNALLTSSAATATATVVEDAATAPAEPVVPPSPSQVYKSHRKFVAARIFETLTATGGVDYFQTDVVMAQCETYCHERVIPCLSPQQVECAISGLSTNKLIKRAGTTHWRDWRLMIPRWLLHDYGFRDLSMRRVKSEMAKLRESGE